MNHVDARVDHGLGLCLRERVSLSWQAAPVLQLPLRKNVMNHSSLPFQIAFVKACWHEDIVDQALKGFDACLSEAGFNHALEVFSVPGSLEIPLQCQTLARSQRYCLIVAAGLIVDGGIYRHDFVASTVLDGMMRVQLDTAVPILSVVLTPHHFNDGVEHQKFFHDHFQVKGQEAARACRQVLQGVQNTSN